MINDIVVVSVKVVKTVKNHTFMTSIRKGLRREGLETCHVFTDSIVFKQ